MSDPLIIVEERGPILLMGINRSTKLNAFTPELIRELSWAYKKLADDPKLRVGVLWATGKDFTAGLDMGEMVKAIPMMPFKPLIPRGAIDPWGVQTPPCPKPVVTAVQGRCYTLGIELMLANQISVVSEGAMFTQYEVSRGLFPFGGGTVRWPQSVGANNANMHLLTGDWFDAHEAYRIGLAQKVVTEAGLVNEAVKIAEVIAAQAPLGVQTVMQSMREYFDRGERTALGKINMHLVKILLTKDFRRAMKAFKNRTEAKYEGD